jgi:DNA-binding LacI/PurR family transcriptional regulator
VIVDNERGAALAVEHLVGLKHCAIATIAGPQHLSNARGRLAGLRKTLHKFGIPIAKSYIEIGDFKQDSGYHSAKRLLSRKDRPTAIFSANIEMTAGLVAYVREAGIAIPKELSVVSFDDAFWTRYIDPPLTVIAQPMEAMGKCAMELLLARLRGSKPPKIQVFAPKLIVRGSTATPHAF